MLVEKVTLLIQIRDRSPVIIYTANSTLETIAIQGGKDMRETLYKASGTEEIHSHVNYAYRDESLEVLYGSRERKLEKLRSLKKLYDPKEKFNFYAPIQRECHTRRTETYDSLSLATFQIVMIKLLVLAS